MEFEKLKKYIFNKLNQELPIELSYHNLNHTLKVFEICEQYIERLNLPQHEAQLLKTAAIMHDTGYIWDFNNHENFSIQYTRKILPAYNYSSKEIDTISNIIEATKIPQQPTTLLEKIIGDADLDYLGTNAFYEIGETLYVEFLSLKIVKNEEEWDKLQIQFLQKHHYHTEFAQTYREPIKQKHLQELISKHS